LKIIINRLRSTLGQEKLEVFMMMNVEKELLDEISFDDILEHVKERSPLKRKMLS
jgi:phosphopantetheine adenylyltransferase